MPNVLDSPQRAVAPTRVHPTGAPIGLVFLGCGAITRSHTRTIRRIDPTVRLYYASRDPARAASYSRELSGQSAFGSYHAALESREVDLVLIATPPASHLALTLAALDRGKTVIVEKPAFLTSAEAASVEMRASEIGGRVYVAENYCYKPITRLLRQVVESGELGEILFLHVNATKQQRTTGWRADPSLAGGGALFEGGIHWVHLMANLGLEVESVAGFEAGTRRPVERSSLVVFRYRGGAIGTLQHSWETPTLLRGLRLSKIAGTRGAITFESNGVGAIVRGRKLRVHWPGLADIRGYRAMFRDFFRSLETGDPTRMTLAMARRDLELVEAASERNR